MQQSEKIKLLTFMNWRIFICPQESRVIKLKSEEIFIICQLMSPLCLYLILS